jgi:hypothetical protein
MRTTPDQIDWTAIGTHIYRQHERIPQSIDDLKHPDPERRERARNFLLGYGQDFGSYYGTTPLIVGFVLDALGDNDTPDKWELMMALRGPFEGMLNDWGTIAMKRIQLAIYDVARARIPHLLTLLTDATADVRQGAARLLGYLTEDRHQLVPILLQHAAREADAAVGCELCRSVKRLIHGPMSWDSYASLDPLPVFYELIVLHPIPEVRVAAAQAAVELRDAVNAKWRYPGFWQEVARLLLDAFRIQSRHLRFPDAYEDVYTIKPLLSDLSRLAPAALLPTLASPELSAEQTHLLAMAVMINACLSDHVIPLYWEEQSLYQGHDDRVFRYSPHRLLYEQSPRSLDLVQAVLDSPRVWEIPTTMFSVLFGMPDTRDELRVWLAQHAADR